MCSKLSNNMSTIELLCGAGRNEYIKKWLKISLVSLAMAGTSACGIMGIFGGDDEGPQPAELVKFKQEARINTAWSSGVGKGTNGQLIRMVPAIEGQRIYAADINGEVWAFDRLTGKRTWQTALKTRLSSGVGSGFGLLLVGTTDGEVIALNETDGSIAWRANLSSEVLSVPQSNGDIVLVQTLDDKVFALEQDTGEQRWLYESIIPALTLRGSSSPILSNNVAVVGLANGKVVALNPDSGQMVWEHRISTPQGRSELERMTDVDGDLLLVGDTVYATSLNGNVAAIEVATARIRWQKEISSYHGVDEGFSNIYLANDTDEIIALEQSSGNSAWIQGALDHRKISAPVTFGNYVVVGDFEGYLHVLSQIDGRFVSRKKLDGDGLSSGMVARGDLLYVYGNSGKLHALRIN